MLFSLRKHHLELFVADTALTVSRSLYCFTTSKSHGVENNFPRLWGTGISDAIFDVFTALKLLVWWDRDRIRNDLSVTHYVPNFPICFPFLYTVI